MIYLDTSFLAPFYVHETTSEAVEAILLDISPQLVISDWTIVEFTSLLSRRVRMGELTPEMMRTTLQSFQEDATQSYRVLAVTAADFRYAALMIQQWESGLRAGDALHLASAYNAKVDKVLSLDRKLIEIAQQFGITADSGGL